MKAISQLTQKEKFNKFITECESYAEHVSINKDIHNSFPAFVLFLYFNFDEIEIKEAIRKLGSNDEGIDAFFYNEEKDIVNLIQFKSRRNYDEKCNKDAQKTWFSFLNNSADKLKNKTIATSNTRIKEISYLMQNDYKDSDLKKYIFHLGECSDNVLINNPEIEYIGQSEILQKFVEFYEKDLEDEGPEKVYLDINPVQAKAYNSNSNHLLFTPKTKNGNNYKDRKSLIFPIDGFQLVRLIEQGTTILERNVRGYLGDTNNVNKGIIQTAMEDPTLFYFFNNGISITCDSLKLINNNKRVELTRAQIINGAQTVNSLKIAYDKKLKSLGKKDFTSKEKAEEHMKTIYVLCKIMESNKSETSYSIFSKKITHYNNTQNKIKEADFYSNRPEQKILKQLLEKYKINYSIKRGKYLIEKDGSKTKEFKYKTNIDVIPEIYLSFEHLEPRSGKIFTDDCENDENSTYFKIFGNKGNASSETNERAKKIAEYIYLHNSIIKNIEFIKSFYSILENIKNKSSKEKVEDKDIHLFITLTGSSLYCNTILNRNEDDYIDDVSKYFFIMEHKIIEFIINQVLIHIYIISDTEKINGKKYYQQCLEEKKYEMMDTILKNIFSESLDVYAKAIKELNIEQSSQFKRKHPKNKESINKIKEVISLKISRIDYVKLKSIL